jgi:hypothetical protein
VNVKRKFKQMHPISKSGWTEWVYPHPIENYLMKCCDCGLVHEMQFKAFVEKNPKRGAFEVVRLPLPIRTMLRARRARGRGVL